MGFGHSKLTGKTSAGQHQSQPKGDPQVTPRAAGGYQTSSNKVRASGHFGGSAHQVGGGKNPTRLKSGGGRHLV